MPAFTIHDLYASMGGAASALIPQVSPAHATAPLFHMFYGQEETGSAKCICDRFYHQ